MKNVVAILSLIFLVGCGPTSGKIPVQIVAPLNESMSDYGLNVLELPRVINIGRLQGERFTFIGGANTPWGIYTDVFEKSGNFDAARENLLSMLPLDSVNLNLTWNGWNYEAADFDSLYLLSAYYQFEKVADFMTEVVRDRSCATTTPAKIFVYGAFTSRGLIKIPSGFVDNSAYLPMGDLFRMYRVGDQEGLPFQMNPGVIAHEFHHRIFHELIFRSKGDEGFRVWKILSTPEISLKSVRARLLLRATDEGLADIHAVGFTGNVDFLSLSKVGTESADNEDQRGLEGQFADVATYDNLAQGLIDRKWIAQCGGESLNFANPNWRYYCLGTVIARTLWETAERNLEILRQEILPAINQALGPLSESILTGFENYDLDVLWRAILGKLSAQRSAALCEQVRTRFGSLYTKVTPCL